MDDTITYRWLSAHLYYNEPWEAFLSNALLPFADTTIKTGATQQYFFIRYWDRGPHIRLRFKGEESVIHSILQPNLEEHFQRYFDDHPSFRIDPNYPDNFPANIKWHPNNTIQFVDYERETARYSGKKGMQISEQHFQLSSTTVLNIVNDRHNNWVYDDALANALRLNISFAFSLGFSLEEAAAFFEMLYKNWLPRTLPNLKKPPSPQEQKEALNTTQTTFERTFQLQRASLIKHHQIFWNAFQDGSIYEQQYFSDWAKGNQVIKTQLEQAAQQGALAQRPEKYRYEMDQGPHSLLWSLYADYVHLTNNRLGVLNKDESFIAFLIMKSMQQLSLRQSKMALKVQQQDQVGS